MATSSLSAANFDFRTFSAMKDFIIERVAEADSRIYFITSSLASTDIATALILASFRGVTVRVLVNQKDVYSAYSRYRYLKNNAVNVRSASFVSNYPYSVLVIDNKTYKYLGVLSKFYTKASYRMEILAGQKTAEFFAQKFHHYYRGGIGVDPGSFLIRVPQKYAVRRAGAKRGSVNSRKLPQRTIIQKRNAIRHQIDRQKYNSSGATSTDVPVISEKANEQPFEIENIEEKESPDEESL